MNSCSFRSDFYDYQNINSVNDLSPFGGISGKSYRQSSKVRKLLYDDFFNDDDKSFIKEKDYWVLSADTKYWNYYVGHYWIVFISIKKIFIFLKQRIH